LVDLFEYPLTAMEVFNYYLSAFALNGQAEGYGGQASIFSELQNLIQKKVIEYKDNFYFLSGREEIVNTRKTREVESERKLKRAKRAAKFLGWLPFVRAVIVCNVLGYKNAKAEDDIDFLVITAPGRIWTARWFATGFFKILNLRPNRKTIKNKFCFSFYLAEDGLNLEKINLADDPYLIWWFAGLIPLYDAGGVFERFMKENEWIKEYLPNLKKCVIPGSRPTSPGQSPGGRVTRDPEKKFLDSGSRAGMTIKNICQFVASLFPEKIYQKFQSLIMPKILKNQANKTPGVIINDQILKFHLVDRRAEFAKRYKKRIMNYEL
jgi:hypothetical protein